MSIQHKAVAGVTGKMMKWLFANMDKVATDHRTGDMYQLYVLMHPIDNVYMLYGTQPLVVNATDPSAGTSLNFDTFYASGCKAVYRGKQPTVVCPVARSGFTCTTPAWIVQNATRAMAASFYAAKLDSSGFTAVIPVGSQSVYQLRYTWQVVVTRGVPMMYITSNYVAGVEDEALAGVNSQIITTSAESTNGDYKLLMAKLALHEVELFGFLPSWLPKIYRAATGRK